VGGAAQLDMRRRLRHYRHKPSSKNVSHETANRANARDSSYADGCPKQDLTCHCIAVQVQGEPLAACPEIFHNLLFPTPFIPAASVAAPATNDLVTLICGRVRQAIPPQGPPSQPITRCAPSPLLPVPSARPSNICCQALWNRPLILPIHQLQARSLFQHTVDQEGAVLTIETTIEQFAENQK